MFIRQLKRFNRFSGYNKGLQILAYQNSQNNGKYYNGWKIAPTGFLAIGLNQMEREEKDDFYDIHGMDDIVEEFRLIVDIAKNPEKYTKIGAHLPRFILLRGKSGSGKTLIGKAIERAGVDVVFGYGPELTPTRIKEMFQSKSDAPRVIFVDLDLLEKAQRANLQLEMDKLENNKTLVIATTSDLYKKNPINIQYDLEIRIGNPNTEGRKSILRYFLNKTRHSDVIDIETLALSTRGYNGLDLQNVVNFAAMKAAGDNDVEIDNGHIIYGLDKVMAGPELMSMKKRSPAATKSLAIHEAGHCLVAYLLNQKDGYFRKPRVATIIGRFSSNGHVALQLDEKDGRERNTISQMRCELDTFMAGRAAEAIFYGEENVGTGAHSDMSVARSIANSIVCGHSGHPDQIKGYHFGRVTAWSEKTKELVDRLVGEEIDNAYKRATKMLKENSELHNILIDALIKYKTLDAREIDLLMKTKSLPGVQMNRERIIKERQNKREAAEYRKNHVPEKDCHRTE